MKFKPINKYLFSKYRMILIDFDFHEKSAWENPYGVTFELFREEDSRLLEEVLQRRDFRTNFSMEEVKKRLRRNILLTVAKKDGRIIGYDWLALESFYIQFLGATIYPGPEEVYGVFCFIDPKFRGWGVLGALQGFEYDVLRKRGYRRVIGMYSESNLAARKAYAKFGYKPIGEVTHGYFMTFRYLRAKIPFRGIKIKADPFAFWRVAIKKGIPKMRSRRLGSIFRQVSAKPVADALTESGERDV